MIVRVSCCCVVPGSWVARPQEADSWAACVSSSLRTARSLYSSASSRSKGQLTLASSLISAQEHSPRASVCWKPLSNNKWFHCFTQFDHNNQSVQRLPAIFFNEHFPSSTLHTMMLSTDFEDKKTLSFNFVFFQIAWNNALVPFNMYFQIVKIEKLDYYNERKLWYGKTSVVTSIWTV